MLLKRRAALNGVQLDEIDNRIIIQGIDAQAGKEQINTVALWGANGSRVTAQNRDYLDVIIKFSLNIKQDAFETRGELMEMINGWAVGGGVLTVSTKPGRKLCVMPQQLPGDGDAMDWASTYSMTLRAYGVPYWQDEIGNKLQIPDASSLNRQFGVPGNVKSTIDAEFYNSSGARIDTFTIQTGIAVIQLTSLGLQNKERLIITHLDNGKRNLLRIMIQDRDGVIRSAMDKRTASSSDDLWTEPGTIRVRMSAGGNGTLLVTAAGRYA